MSGYVDEINLTNMGFGYTCYPDVVIEGSIDPNGSNSGAEASVNMTVYNPIHSIVMDDNYIENNFFETAPVVTIETNGTGSGATAIVQLSAQGQVERVESAPAGCLRE